MCIKAELIELLKTDKSILIAAPMSEEMKKEVLKLEMKRLEELVPFVNEGMKEAFEEEEALVVILDNTVKNERVENSYDEQDTSFTLRNESGMIIGETIMDEEELNEELKNSKYSRREYQRLVTM